MALENLQNRFLFPNPATMVQDDPLGALPEGWGKLKITSIIGNDMDLNDHVRLSNITLRHKVKEQLSYCCSTFHSHSRKCSYTKQSL
jgi:hypothetical protein